MTLGWTEADDAELDVLVDALIGAALVHSRLCKMCMGHSPCKAMREAEAAVLEWQWARRLLSKAEFLRAELKSKSPA